MLRYIRYTVELIAAFVGVGIVLAVLLVWRLSSSPIISDFMTPYIESGIERIVPDSDVHVGSSLLTWSGLQRSISMHAEKITVTDASGAEIAEIPSIDANMSLLGLIFGQFLPKDLVIISPQIKLTRNTDGAFVFGGMAVGGSPASAPSDIGSGKTKSVLQNVAAQLSHASLMDKILVSRATFDVHDTLTQKDWAVQVPEISVAHKVLTEINHKLKYGALEGHMTVEVTQKDSVATVEVNYLYDPEKDEHVFSTVFAGLTPAFMAGGHPETLGLNSAAWINLPLTGNLKVAFAKDLSIENLETDIHGDEGELVYPAFWDLPCPVKSLTIAGTYDRNKDKSASFTAHLDVNGPTVAVTFTGTKSSTPGHDLDFTSTLAVENLPMNSYGDLWPKSILPDSRYWLMANLRNGVFTHSDVTLKGALTWSDLSHFAVSDVAGKMNATNGRVTYMPSMPPVEDVDAEATFDASKMEILIKSGGIGNIHMTPFTITISGLSDPDQSADIPLAVVGPLSDVMRLIDRPPLGYAKSLGISPDDLGGQIQGVVDFRFPLEKTLQMSDVDIHATANTSGLSSAKLIPNLTVDQGNLALTLDVNGFTLNGDVGLNKIPAQINWQENFGAVVGKPLRRTTVSATIRDDQWSSLGISALNGTKGPTSVMVEVVEPTKARMTLTGTFDMGAAALKVERFGWNKPANVPALLKFSAEIPVGKPISVTSISLRGPQATADGTAVFSPDFSELMSLTLSHIVLGRTDAAVSFNQSFGPGGSLRLDASGAALDVSGLRGTDAPDEGDIRPKEYHVHVDKLYTDENSSISSARGFAVRDREGWSSMDLQGIADPNTPLNISLSAQADGRRTLRMACDNFGDAMKALGYTDTVKGGQVLVSGESTLEAPRTIVGHAKIDDFTVQKLPALALLLNATSPFGFRGILTDSASFSRFEGDFTLQGDTLSLTRAHAAGSAIGINVDGKVDMSTGNASLQGTLVPFSTVNNILNFIPIVGGLITGGDDQGVLAVTYEIKGPLNAPKVSVNPISLLTPGFIRNLFFRDEISETK